ncbi:MAG: hypothetical protein H6598_06635 [Flavobacteriales bacterium]|nr:hypothetical protein [Flavobacteriales bacterium]
MQRVLNLIDHFRIRKLMGSERNSFNSAKHDLKYRLVSFLFWVILIPLKILDLFGVFTLIDLVRSIVLKTRSLQEVELVEIEKIFAHSLDYKKIRIREGSFLAKLGARSVGKKHLAFVLFRTVNFSRKIDQKNADDMAWLIHELTHVIQFEYIGIQYIVEALRAQNNEGYDYQGEQGLRSIRSICELNLEQQADVARDFYKRIISGMNVDLYKPFIEDMKKGKV